MVTQICSKNPFTQAWMAEWPSPAQLHGMGHSLIVLLDTVTGSIPALVFPPIVPTLSTQSHNNGGLSWYSLRAGENKCEWLSGHSGFPYYKYPEWLQITRAELNLFAVPASRNLNLLAAVLCPFSWKLLVAISSLHFTPPQQRGCPCHVEHAKVDMFPLDLQQDCREIIAVVYSCHSQNLAVHHIVVAASLTVSRHTREVMELSAGAVISCDHSNSGPEPELLCVSQALCLRQHLLQFWVLSLFQLWRDYSK